jgi:hypothetical protein
MTERFISNFLHFTGYGLTAFLFAMIIGRVLKKRREEMDDFNDNDR